MTCVSLYLEKEPSGFQKAEQSLIKIHQNLTIYSIAFYYDYPRMSCHL